MADETVIGTLVPQPIYTVGDPDVAVVTIHDPAGFPFPGCALNEAVSTLTAETWYDNGSGLLPGMAGFFLAPTIIRIRRTGITSASPVNASSGYSYKAARTDAQPEGFNMPHDCVVSAVNIVSGGNSIWSGWGYIFFENIPYWETQELQIDWLAFTGDLFDPALAGGVEIWCCDTPGIEPPRDNRGRDVDVFNFGGTGNSTTIYAGNPPELPSLVELLYTVTDPNQFPITIPVPAGRGLMFRTVNQDPQTLPSGSSIFGDINVGFPSVNPTMAYKVVKSEDPEGAAFIFTTAAANRLRLKSLVREVSFGGAFDHEHTVLIYRDPVRATGTTLRFPITDPYLWYTEDPAATFIGGGMEVTLTAFEVDESELTGTPEENWQIVKAWGYTDIESRIGAEIAHVDFVTSSANAFASGSGDFDAAIGTRKLVYYKLTAAADQAHPGAGLHMPSILHGNASLF